MCPGGPLQRQAAEAILQAIDEEGGSGLVVWLPFLAYFPIHIGLLIIPIDELIFFRGVAQPPTSCGF